MKAPKTRPSQAEIRRHWLDLRKAADEGSLAAKTMLILLSESRQPTAILSDSLPKGGRNADH